MKTINKIYLTIKEGLPPNIAIKKLGILPGSYYSGRDMLVRKGYISEDFDILKEYISKTPFYGFKNIESKYPIKNVEGYKDYDFITRIVGKYNDIDTGTNIGVKKDFEVKNHSLYLIKDKRYKVKQLFIKGDKISYYNYGLGQKYINHDMIIGEAYILERNLSII